MVTAAVKVAAERTVAVAATPTEVAMAAVIMERITVAAAAMVAGATLAAAENPKDTVARVETGGHRAVSHRPAVDVKPVAKATGVVAGKTSATTTHAKADTAA